MLNEFQKIAGIMWENLITLWPYLVITIPLAVAVNVTGASKYITKSFKKNPYVSILLAAVIGAFSPFCSCGVIPLITSLLIGGVPLAPVMAFWLASPSMDPEIFFLSVSTIGWDLAVWRLAATFAMSLSAGYITHFFILKGWLGKSILNKTSTAPIDSTAVIIKKLIKSLKKKFAAPNVSLAFAETNFTPQTASCGCSSKPATGEKNDKENDDLKKPVIIEIKDQSPIPLRIRLLNETISASAMVLKFMTLAFFLEAVIMLYVPEELIISLLGQNNPFAIITATLVGIPVYTSSIPALAMMGGLLNQGMAPAAVLSFLIAGPTTTLPAMAAVWNIASKRVFIMYVSFTLLSAVLAGYLYEIINAF